MDKQSLPIANLKSAELQWTVTPIEADECTYYWKIQNFNLLQKKTGEALFSPPFYAEKNRTLQWRLKIYSEGNRQVNSDCISLFLYPVKPFSCEEIRANFCISLLNDEKETINSHETSYVFNKDTGDAFGWSRFLSKKELKNPSLLPDDSLHILCYIKIFATIGKTISGKSVDNSFKPFVLSLESLFDSDEFHDFTIITRDRTFKTHRNILAAASPVFWKMLTHDMRENFSKSVKIVDASSKVIYEMLRFVYTSRVESLDEIAEELLIVADKYQIQGLKELCERSLCKNLNDGNVCSLLMLGDQYQGKRLREEALQHVVKKRKLLRKTEGFRKLLRNSHLVEDIFATMVIT